MHTNITLFTLLFSNSNENAISTRYVISLHCFVAEVVADPPSFPPPAAAGASVGVWAFLPLVAVSRAGAGAQLIVAHRGWHSSLKRAVA